MPEPHAADYFVIGGTLRTTDPSYVERPADKELYQAVQRGEFCYVLTARQMGKSSLMARTARRLQQEQVQTAIIDLTQIGTVPVEQWYFDFVSSIADDLDLATDAEAWWLAHKAQGIVRRFTNFLRDVVLEECEGNVVIFVDEIDFTLSLDFSDDFFAAIRAVYNNRARDAIFERLTFVLMGVASPADLMKDRTRTPFNVGRRVELGDFAQADMKPLATGLETIYPEQSATILRRIYFWTQGHPNLTQKLCQAVAEAQTQTWSNAQVDKMVEQIFLRKEASKEDNLEFVRSFVLGQANQRDMLTHYRQIYRGQEVADNERSPVINQLKLAGLVKSEGGYLQSRNEIYRHVFDADWIKSHLAIDWTRVGLVVAVMLLFLIGIYTVHNGVQNNMVTDANKALSDQIGFQERLTVADACQHLKTMVDPQGIWQQDYREDTLDVFRRMMAFDDQKVLDMFMLDDCSLEQKEQFIGTIYKTLAYTDWESKQDSTYYLLEKMSLLETGYQAELVAWVAGRKAWQEGDRKAALAAYQQAIKAQPNNGATRWERAHLFILEGDKEAAAADLAKVLELASEMGVVVAESAATSESTAVAVSAPITVTATVVVTGTPRVVTSTISDSQVEALPLSEVPEGSNGNNPLAGVGRQAIEGKMTVLFESGWDMQLAVSQLLESSAEMRAFLLESDDYPELQALLSGGTRAQDGMEMVAVPAGSFTMGSSEAEIDFAFALCEQYRGDCQRDWFADEAPAHTVQLDGFQIDKTEVTNSQMAIFLNELGNQEEDGVTWVALDSDSALLEENPSTGTFQPLTGFGNHPAIMVSWYGANAYCAWAGGQLPTEAQWEYAARGSAGNIFPWGNEFDGNRLNYCDSNCEFDWLDESVDDGYVRTAPVSNYPAGESWVDAQDMAGNVWEWTADWYEVSYENATNNNPTGPATGTSKVLRGGSWVNVPYYVRGAYRFSLTPVNRNVNVGFRCVVEPGN